MTPKTLIVHVPLSWDRVHRSFFKSWVELTSPEMIKELNDKGVSVKYLIDESFPLDFNRNKAVETMLTFGAEWLVCLDADMVFPKRVLPMLLDSATPGGITTGNYHKKGSPHQSVSGWYVQRETLTDEVQDTVRKWGFENADGKQTLIYRCCTEFYANRPFPIDVCGAGCLIIHRDALTALKQPYFKYFDQFLTGNTAVGNITEEMYFFSECKKAGIPVRMDPRIQCGHLSEKEITFMDMDMPAMAMVAPA